MNYPKTGFCMRLLRDMTTVTLIDENLVNKSMTSAEIPGPVVLVIHPQADHHSFGQKRG